MSRVKTGHVVQIREKGPNYIVLGTASVGGERHLIATKNGNIRLDGNAKKPGVNPQTGETAPLKVYAFKANQILRVHQERTVNLNSVFAADCGAAELNDTVGTVRNSRVGVESATANVAAQRFLNA